MYTAELPLLTTGLGCEQHGVPVVSAFGEIDLSTISEFEMSLAKSVLGARELGRMIVDLRGTEFMDVVGMRSLLRARGQLLEACPAGIVIIVCDGVAKRVLEVSGLSEEFALYPDLESASSFCLTAA